jgi:hypothetical protein
MDIHLTTMRLKAKLLIQIFVQQNQQRCKHNLATTKTVELHRYDSMNLKILTQKEFEAEIKQIQRDRFPITMIDAIIEYCTIKNIEVETAASLITPRMKSSIEGEAMKLKMIAPKARLPLEVED